MELAEITTERITNILARTDPYKVNGKVTDVVGLVITSNGPSAVIGEVCKVIDRNGDEVCKAEVVGFKEGKVLSIALGEINNISPQCEIVSTGKSFKVGVGEGLLGRVIDGLGRPIDGKGDVDITGYRDIYAAPPDPMIRKRISQPLQTGVRAIDGLLTCGRGQRIGIFAGSGVGKSTTLGMIARNTDASVNVIILVGERGREVKDFLEKDLGADGLKRSVVVVATGDKSALLRIKSAFLGTTIAEYFRDQGHDVVLMMDSVTRFAMAQREIGLTIGEPPASKGYTPSVFALLPKLLERAGTSDRGSITGYYTVLVDGDDMTEPVADAVRSILDGHIVLSRKLANKAQFPAIDPLQSVSRIMPDVVTKEHRRNASRFTEILANFNEAEDLINIGAYVKGSNPNIDLALTKIEDIKAYLKQDLAECTSFNDAVQLLGRVVS